MGKKGGSRTLKRLVAPKTWRIPRKVSKWIVKPSPGPHPMVLSIPLLVVLRDVLKLYSTAREAKKVIKAGRVLVDGKPRRDYKFPVGLMDTLSIPDEELYLRCVPYKANPIYFITIPRSEINLKICQVIKKFNVKSGRFQVTLHDGRNMIIDSVLPPHSISIGDSLLITVPEQEVKAHIKAEAGNLAMIFLGDRAGVKGVIHRIIPQPYSVPLVELRADGATMYARKDRIMVVGAEKPLIKVEP
uniref:Small ribosomal subunit protein eS4 n=1 Tax=uncultured korarchaeote TaxID=161241 RepID=A0A1L2JPV8_9CREN|nr:ribosomal protein S4E [uncultured korarchaeote]